MIAALGNSIFGGVSIFPDTLNTERLSSFRRPQEKEFPVTNKRISYFSEILIRNYASPAISYEDAARLNEASKEFSNKKRISLERRIINFIESTNLLDSDEQKLPLAIMESLTFLTTIPDDIETPTATLGLDGSITLEWETDSKKAIAIFDGEDEFGYAVHDGKRFVPGKLESNVADGIPSDLKDYLSA